MLERAPAAFVAGFVSVIAPCVLPLLPGYLSTVSGVEARALGAPGSARRVALATLHFIAGFTIVFVAVGAGAAALVGVVNQRSQNEIAGFVLIVVGLAFVGLLPWPERILGPGLLAGARRRGSSVLLGGAFALCAVSCIGPLLAAVLVLATNGNTIAKGAFLLAVYSLGLGSAFLLAGVAFARAMSAFRWLRDHYQAIQVASGVTLIALGVLLFFHRDWWLRVALNRALSKVGLDQL
jgi:cytochrome c-type biogenesis protein